MSRLTILCVLSLCSYPVQASSALPGADVAQLVEMLHNVQQPQSQSQAALLLVQNESPEAEQVVRVGLRRVEEIPEFLALASAVALCRDHRYEEELFAALHAKKLSIRQAVSEALGLLGGPTVLQKLEEIVHELEAPLTLRQTALLTLARIGRKQAVAVLVQQLESDEPSLRKLAADSLESLVGQPWGNDVLRWQTWWERHQDTTEDEWLTRRLVYQSSKAHRLASDLGKARSQVVRLQQKLYTLLPEADRVGHVQTVSQDEDPAVRLLAVKWTQELLESVDPGKRSQLIPILLRTSRDASLEVQRASVLALGRHPDEASFARLRELVRSGQAPVRAAAARSLAMMARGTDSEAVARRKIIVPLLERLLLDPSLEVVVEAAEDLGALGVPEAGPVLVELLRHSSVSVRRAAGQALERVADHTVLEALLGLSDDADATVRFSIVGTMGRIVGDGMSLSPLERERVLARLETWFQKDADAGIRSRAATVLGECGSATHLTLLAKCLDESEDVRVQEKAWSAFLRILVKSEDEKLLREWDQNLAKQKQGQRRIQLLTEAYAKWQEKSAGTHAQTAQEILIGAQLELGKWSLALPLIRDLLPRPGNEEAKNQRLAWLLSATRLAWQDDKKDEVLRILEEVKPYLPSEGSLRDGFDAIARELQLEK